MHVEELDKPSVQSSRLAVRFEARQKLAKVSAEHTGAAETEARRRALADPANYQRYLFDAQDLEWWQTEGRRRAREQ